MMSKKSKASVPQANDYYLNYCNFHLENMLHLTHRHSLQASKHMDIDEYKS